MEVDDAMAVEGPRAPATCIEIVDAVHRLEYDIYLQEVRGAERSRQFSRLPLPAP